MESKGCVEIFLRPAQPARLFPVSSVRSAGLMLCRMTTAKMTTTPGRSHAKDIDLMRRVAAHQPGAFDHLIGLYHQRTRRLSFRLTGWRGEIDDIVQDVF